jgi:hypothetical protein
MMVPANAEPAADRAGADPAALEAAANARPAD